MKQICQNVALAWVIVLPIFIVASGFKFNLTLWPKELLSQMVNILLFGSLVAVVVGLLGGSDEKK